MEKVSVGRILVDHCARCGAMWFDAYELETTLRSAGAVAEVDYGTAAGGRPGFGYNLTNYLASDRMCPRCKRPLTTVPDARQPHVTIDVCSDCRGVLLDAGELKDLSEFTLAERVRAFLKRA
jgi:Zn-finger nucleic acid-binding protein